MRYILKIHEASKGCDKNQNSKTIKEWKLKVCAQHFGQNIAIGVVIFELLLEQSEKSLLGIVQIEFLFLLNHFLGLGQPNATRRLPKVTLVRRDGLVNDLDRKGRWKTINLGSGLAMFSARTNFAVNLPHTSCRRDCRARGRCWGTGSRWRIAFRRCCCTRLGRERNSDVDLSRKRGHGSSPNGSCSSSRSALQAKTKEQAEIKRFRHLGKTKQAGIEFEM